MNIEVIWTPNEHKGKDLKNSPLWEGCYSESEMTDFIRQSKSKWFIYHIKFKGLKPIMITKKTIY